MGGGDDDGDNNDMGIHMLHNSFYSIPPQIAKISYARESVNGTQIICQLCGTEGPVPATHILTIHLKGELLLLMHERQIGNLFFHTGHIDFGQSHTRNKALIRTFL